MNLFFFCTDCFRILHVCLNEYINHVVELLQLKIVESQFTGVLNSPLCKWEYVNEGEMEGWGRVVESTSLPSQLMSSMQFYFLLLSRHGQAPGYSLLFHHQDGGEWQQRDKLLQQPPPSHLPPDPNLRQLRRSRLRALL